MRWKLMVPVALGLVAAAAGGGTAARASALPGGTAFTIPNAAGSHDGSGVEQIDPDLLQRLPKLRVAPRGKNRLAGLRYHRAWIIQQPNRGLLDGLTRLWISVGMTPLDTVAGNQSCLLAGLKEHRAIFQPSNVRRIGPLRFLGCWGLRMDIGNVAEDESQE